ncbi:MAG: cysteine desulfurase [Candidatus Korarchaeota archaeon]|nr:cysteine desulfurase [Candidatus Korarchaeota archaeon]NIU85687.1 aminotransferase class V-fold PLP-dependent enzyme [Candidatus Thorarchaeota archaeon]NIW15781.1 aminotransferase class V-fold PLP-dependent enzyme [Candidatus Thorarchaeota archaeon]NIW53696.1 aminotransferase class V-fold PLP-dependent enzyme [Candidatus Korarchaeota archaeon]
MENDRPTVYLDNSNLSIVPEEVVNAMHPYFSTSFGHPALVHTPGRNSLKLIEESRKDISRTINCEADEITFTSGLTESNNIAIQGIAYAYKEKGNHILISKVEPPSVSRVADVLETEGFKVERVEVNEKGFVKLEHLKERISDETILISISGVADEIGTIEPLKAVNEIIEDKNPEIYLHTDFSNGYTKTPIDVQETGIDLLSVGGRKIHSPPGIGFLFVRDGIKLRKIMEGTLTTSTIRPGLETVPLIGGMRKAVELAFQHTHGNLTTIPKHNEKVRNLRDRLYENILERIDDILLNGSEGKKRSPSNLNISFRYVEGESITLKLSKKGIYVSTGSACARRSLKPSPVLKAIGRTAEESHGSIIFELSRYNTVEEIDYVIEVLPEVIAALRQISALEPEQSS